MRISLSSLLKILHEAFPADSIAINPMGSKKRNHICIEVEYGANMGSIVYDLTNDIAFQPTKRFAQIIEAAVGEVNARQLRESLKKQEEQSNDWSEEAYQREKGEPSDLDILRAQDDGMPTVANLM